MEHETPSEVYAVHDADAGRWQVRVVPNKYPAVQPITPDTRGLTRRINLNQLPGFGVHELVIEGADHEANPTALPDEVYQNVLLTYRDRIITHAEHPRLDYVTVFKNVGAEAGASMAHLHSQIIATPFVPNAIRDELHGAQAWFEKFGRCAFCDDLKHADGDSRFVAESDQFMVICPFASRFAYEFWLLPKEHSNRYETLTATAALDLARLLKRALTALDAAVGEPAYNYYLHTSPLRAAPSPSYHWHIEVTPRTARAAGFEWSTGVFINAVPPEKAAAELREALLK
jgi:UDPglucose--hexose-1-phosphate uridylyltransferase